LVLRKGERRLRSSEEGNIPLSKFGYKSLRERIKRMMGGVLAYSSVYGLGLHGYCGMIVRQCAILRRKREYCMVHLKRGKM